MDLIQEVSKETIKNDASATTQEAQPQILLSTFQEHSSF